MPTEWETVRERSIHVDVAYYDQAHRNKLSAYPNAPAIAALVADGMDVPLTEFLTYYFLHKRDARRPGYRDCRELSRYVADGFGMLRHSVELGERSLYVTDLNNPLRDVSERIGESLGVSVVNRIHGLNMADWTRIDESSIQTLDFKLDASDGNRLVEVECKGSCLPVATARAPTIYNHRADIEAKKTAQRLATGGAPAIRYGTISTLGRTPDANAHCWLLDPPPEGSRLDPHIYRLLARMRFLQRWIALLMPRSRVAAALTTRLDDLLVIKNPAELDGRRLKDLHGEPLRGRASRFVDESRWAGGHARVENGPAFGCLEKVGENMLLFIGIRDDLIDLAVRQDFGKVSSFAMQGGSVEKGVRCSISEHHYSRLGLKGKVEARIAGGRAMFRLSGVLRYSAEGLVFGLVPV